MNVFLLHPDPVTSAKEFAAIDPKRARKQLIECCQLLAAVEHFYCLGSTMKRADGLPYGCCHPHHPCTRQAIRSLAQQRLTYDVGMALAAEYPKHASSRSIREWKFYHTSQASTGYVVVRKGHTPVYVETLMEYTHLIRPYLLAKVAS